jgi:predicted acetyltransferase
MNVEVRALQADEALAFEALYQFYRYDFSEFTDEDVGDAGRYEDDERVHKYVSDPRYMSFLIRADGRLAGLAVVHNWQAVDGSGDVTDMDQFFVMRKYRRRGVGETAATWLFDRFPGRWQIRERRNNLPAQSFWRAIIDRYSSGRYRELSTEESASGGPVQFFTSRATA